MDDRQESGEEWEKELVDVQRNITYDQGLRASQIIARRLSASPAPIPDFGHFLRFILSGVLLVIGFLILSADVPHKVWLGLAALTASCCCGIAAFRWKRKQP